MVREFVKKLVRYTGYEVLGRDRAYAMQRSMLALIKEEQINLVLDVGANTGQFAEELRSAGYAGRIISFEPLPLAHQHLLSRSKDDANWIVADRTAVGADSGSVQIHVAGNSASSSILDMLPSHLEAAPESIYGGLETVPLSRLDDICPLASTDRVLLKLDVQGYEKSVLEGAPGILARCRAVMTEMSFVPLYDGQVMAREMWDLLDADGFDIWSLEQVYRHPASERTLQIDGLFVRR